MSTVTVDIPDNPVSCIDVAPLTALVAVSCPPTKYIRIVKKVTACDKGLIQEAGLRNNFSYTISHNIRDAHFLARKDIQQDNLQIKYNFTNLGCPLLVHHKNPWLDFAGGTQSPDPNIAWTRSNYMSCKDRNGPELMWPSVKYQVLDGDKNKITFPPYNGLYIFKTSVVDTFYSYCDLSVTFSVHVYGAFPTNYLHSGASLTASLTLLLIFTRYSLSHLSL
ncbi:LOW QUALITY PROTEIN: cation channel sperm-associated protein subunit delta-like [Aquila chrysaetos chrysaetos]|uniref:LOW QUALITY PROTEIN: cation channel sperm-associated protein subunit delta-like n=1 Tax=Aquila chrysaetos chrysaetos TaxID=223781 RepID=UPI0011772FEE|nr:LOW QUALITY PROTEIN: cation channel sperm-associated protein subunit delta-like [Aquila chrysaetos chrysaetos]